MALFPPGFRTVAKKIGLPGFRTGQKFGEPAAPEPVATAAPVPLAPAPPPSTTLDASNAVASAKLAAERQRKRAAGGSPLVSAKPAGPKAILQPKQLVGY
jgi:hypothetical protein